MNHEWKYVEKDGLPEYSGQYIVSVQTGYLVVTDTANYYSHSQIWHLGRDYQPEGKVIAWMLLPIAAEPISGEKIAMKKEEKKMTREDFMIDARKTANKILNGKENAIMNLVEQAYAEGKRSVSDEIQKAYEAGRQSVRKEDAAHWSGWRSAYVETPWEDMPVQFMTYDGDEFDGYFARDILDYFDSDHVDFDERECSEYTYYTVFSPDKPDKYGRYNNFAEDHSINVIAWKPREE